MVGLVVDWFIVGANELAIKISYTAPVKVMIRGVMGSLSSVSLQYLHYSKVIIIGILHVLLEGQR